MAREDIKSSINTPSAQPQSQGQRTATTGDTQGFDQLAQALKTAVDRFQDESTPENFAGIVSALSRFGISGADLWKQVADYSKQHPIRVALGAAVVFFAAKGLVRETSRRGTVH